MKFLKKNQLDNQNIKNTAVSTLGETVYLDVTEGVVMPRGMVSQRPSAPINGYIRYNTDDTVFEFYQDDAWVTYSTSTNLILPDHAKIVSGRVEVVDSTTTLIDSFISTQYRSSTYLISLHNAVGSDMLMLELLYDGRVVTLSLYGSNTVGTALGTFDAIIYGNAIRLLFIPTISGTTITFYRRSLPCLFDVSAGNYWYVDNNPVVVDNTHIYVANSYAPSLNTVVIDTFDSTLYRGGIYEVQLSCGITYEVCKISVLNNNGILEFMRYSDNISDSSISSLGNFDFSFVNSNIVLSFTPTQINIDIICGVTLIKDNFATPVVNLLTGNVLVTTGQFQTTSLNTVTVDSFNILEYRGGEYQIHLESGNNFYKCNLLVGHDATTPTLVQYLNMGTTLGEFTISLSNDIVTLEFTPNTTNAISGIYVKSILDTGIPLAPTVRLLDDTGNNNGDFVTNNGTVLVSGVELGAIWKYSINSGMTWIQGIGNSFLLDPGAYALGTIEVIQVNAHGYSSLPVTPPATIIVDVTAPSAPIMTLLSDTGDISTDGITSNGTVLVSGIEQDAVWEYSLDSGTTWTTGSNFQFTIPHGIYPMGYVKIKQTDVAGNVSAIRSNNIGYIIDTIIPSTPTISLLVDAGGNSFDSITNVGTIIVSNLESNATWDYSIDSGNTWARGTGTTFTINSGTYGSGVIKVRQQDVAGNYSNAAYNINAITIDTTLPASLTFSLADDSGVSPTDWITNNGIINISGIENDATWEYSIDFGTSWTAGVGSSFVLPSGTYTMGTIKVRQSDLAGNTSITSTNGLTIKVDVTIPPSLTMALAADNGISSSDSITNNGTMDVSGIESGAIWQYSINSGVSWSTGVGSTFTLPSGLYSIGSIKLRQIDVAGNVSPITSNTTNIEIDTTSPISLSFSLQSDTGISMSDGVTNNGIVIVNGIENGAIWEYSIDSGVNWIVGTNSSFQLSEGIYGIGSIKLRQNDVAGNVSMTVTNSMPIIVDQTLPSTISMSLYTDSGINTTDGITNNGIVNVSDIESGATWQYSINSGSTWNNGAGASFILPSGTYNIGSIQIKQTDVAGNSSAITHNIITIQVDTTLPAAPSFALASDMGISSSDGITHTGIVNVTGIESGAMWEYSTNSGLSWITGSGTNFILSAGNYGIGTIKVKQTDVAGNVSPITTNNTSITIDTTAPSTLTIVSMTNAGLITISGIELGATWQYSYDSGVTWNSGFGTTFALVANTYAAGIIQIRQTDIAGNTSAITSNSIELIVDITPPTAPNLSLAVDTGSSSIDGITNNGTINVIGLENGATWNYSIDSGLTWNIGTGSSFILPEGSYPSGTILITQSDIVGNTSAENSNSNIIIVVDTTQPPPLTFNLRNDTGISASDNITKLGNVDIVGLITDSTWQYSIDGGSTWVVGNGTSFVLPESVYNVGSVCVRQIDIAGNISDITSNTVVIIIDTTAPNPPDILLATDTGISSSDGVTNNGLINVSGLESGAIWQYSTDSGSTWNIGSGTAFILSSGTYAPSTILVSQTDIAGNTSTPSHNLTTITVDTTAPSPLSFILQTDTGISSSDNISNTGIISVSGIESGASWRYSIDSGALWTTGTGATFTLPSGIYGIGSIKVYQTDITGNDSAITSNVSLITIDTSLPSALTLSLAFDTGNSTSDWISNIGTINVSGIELNATWKYSINSGATWISGVGTSFTLSAGTYSTGTVRVNQTDIAGNTSTTTSNVSTIIIDTNAPASLNISLATDSGISSSDWQSNVGTIVVTGIELNAKWQYSTNAGTSWTNGIGSTFTLPPGTYSIGAVQVKQMDVAGNTSAVTSNNTVIIIDDSAPNALSFALLTDTGTSTTDNISNSNVMVVTGLEPDATWQYSIDYGISWITPTGYTFNLPEGTYGIGSIKVFQTDSSGNIGPISSSTQLIIIDIAPPATPTIASSELNGKLTIGNLESNSIWQYSTDSGVTWNTGNNNTIQLLVGIYPINSIQLRQYDVAGNVSDISGNPSIFNVGSNFLIASKSVTNTTIGITVLDSFPILQYRTAKYLIELSHSTGKYLCEAVVIHNGGSAFITEYPINTIDSMLGAINADISGGQLRLLFTPLVSDVISSIYCQYLPVSFVDGLDSGWNDGYNIINIDNYKTISRHYITPNATTELDRFPVISHISGTYMIQLTIGIAYHTCILSFLNNNGVIELTQSTYSAMIGSVPVGTFNMSIQVSDIVLTYTPPNASVDVIYGVSLLPVNSIVPINSWVSNVTTISSGRFASFGLTPIIIDTFDVNAVIGATYEVYTTDGSTNAIYSISELHNDATSTCVQQLKFGVIHGSFTTQKTGDTIQVTFTPTISNSITGTFVKTMVTI